MAYRSKTRSRRRTSYKPRKKVARRRTANQTIRIVVENPAPQMPQAPSRVPLVETQKKRTF